MRRHVRPCLVSNQPARAGSVCRPLPWRHASTGLRPLTAGPASPGRLPSRFDRQMVTAPACPPGLGHLTPPGAAPQTLAWPMTGGSTTRTRWLGPVGRLARGLVTKWSIPAGNGSPARWGRGMCADRTVCLTAISPAI